MRRAVFLVVVLLAVAGCGLTAGAPVYVGSGLRPLNVGWENHLSVTWETGTAGGGQLVSGYVRNTSPYDLANVRVLVEALDAGGQVTEQRVRAIPGELRGGGRVYFDVPVPSAPSYRVRVFSYERLESAGLVS
jgi:hypothetical protein